jgi:hypothetical protein
MELSMTPIMLVERDKPVIDNLAARVARFAVCWMLALFAVWFWPYLALRD